MNAGLDVTGSSLARQAAAVQESEGAEADVRRAEAAIEREREQLGRLRAKAAEEREDLEQAEDSAAAAVRAAAGELPDVRLAGGAVSPSALAGTAFAPGLPQSGLLAGGSGGAFGDLGDLPTLLPPHILALLENIRRDRLDGIERDYQVEEEELVDWEPPFPASLWPGSEPAARTEAELLDKMSLDELSILNTFRGAADDEAKRFPDSGENDGHQDAYRHTYASVLMASYFGEEFTRQLTSAHEARPGNPSAREAMDLHNNEVGRRIAAEAAEDPSINVEERVRRAVEDGEVLVIDRDGRLAFSDEVAPGETGEAVPDKRLPGGPLERPDEGYEPGYGVKE